MRIGSLEQLELILTVINEYAYSRKKMPQFSCHGLEFHIGGSTTMTTGGAIYAERESNAPKMLPSAQSPYPPLLQRNHFSIC